MCDLRLNSLGEKLCPISLPSPGGGARSEWSSLTGAAHWREPGQTPRAAGMDGSLRPLGFPGPLWPGKGLLHCTQGDHFSGWGRMERPLGRRTSPVMSSMLSVALCFSRWEQGAPTVSGATGVLARTPVPPSTVKEKVGPRKAGAVEKRQGRMPGHLALNSSGIVSQVGGFLIAAKSYQLSPRMALSIGQGADGHLPLGMWQSTSRPFLGC